MINRKIAGMLLLAIIFIAPGALWAQGEVFVQVLASENQALAQKEAGRLSDLGVPARVQTEDVPEKGLWHKVYIGPFDNAAEAKAACENLKQDGLIKEYFVKTDALVASPGAVTPSPQPAQGEGTVEVDPETGVVRVGGPSGPQVAEPVNQLPVAQTPTYGERIPEDADVNTAAPAPVVAPPSYGPGDGPVVINQDGTVQDFGAGGTTAPVTVKDPAPVVVAPEPARQPAPVAEPAPVNTSAAPPKIIPAKPRGPMTIQGFVMLVDLSSSMRKMAGCQGRIKEEAVAGLLRKMNHRIPSHPYTATLRVFGYKKGTTRKDYTTIYFGPAAYDRDRLETEIGRLTAADAISPFGFAIKASENEISVIPERKAAVFMFSDFEETTDPGGPVEKVKEARRNFGNDVKVYTFYVTRQGNAVTLAKDIAKAGDGQAYDICDLLNNPDSFEKMMTDIFGPSDEPACPDNDSDGVCDRDDKCPNTPYGAPVDWRGCWIAAYAQFFDFDKAVVKSAFLPRLEHAAGLIKNLDIKDTVVIAGHTDSQGTEAYNMDLGRRRAQAVYDLMVKYGVPAEKMRVESYGKSRPIADNGTEEGRAQNRRVEFHIGDVPPAE